MTIRNLKTIKERRIFVEKKTGRKLPEISVYPNQLDGAQYRNCENMIGATSVPLGIAGPLKIKSDHLDGEFLIPLSTTEGALVASVNRGCKAITSNGGAFVSSEYKGITRAAIFDAGDLKRAFLIKDKIGKSLMQLENIAKSMSSHLTLKDVEVKVLGGNIYVRLSFDSQDAMGMNMATIATEKIAGFIDKSLNIRCISIAGNFDTDKKPSWLNFIMGRGRQVWAQVVLSKKTVGEILKSTPEKIEEVNIAKNLYGSALSGSLGYNGHFANIIAAIFLATGQDIAHTVEGSLGITTTKISQGKLNISVYLPDLIVGTIGGGTGLPSQKEALNILGITGGNDGKNAQKFAEIIGASVLAGEISLLASLAQGSLAGAHRRLARGEM